MILLLILFFLTILAPGYLLLTCLRRPGSRFSPVDIFLAYGLGAFFVSIQIFIDLFIFRLNFSVLYFSLILAAECLAMLIWAIRKKLFIGSKPEIIRQDPLSPGKRAVLFLLVFFVLSNCLVAVINAAYRPPVFFDSIAMWSFKAKTLVYHQPVDFNPDSYYYLGGGGNLNYPWGVPLAQFWLYSVLGRDNDLAANFIFIAYFFSLLGVIFYFSRRFVDLIHSWLAVFLVSSLPLLFFHSFNAYADLPLAFYVLIASVFWLAYLREGGKRNLAFSGIFWAAAAWTKDTAWFFILAVLFVTLIINIREKKFLDFLSYCLSIFLPLAPWLVFAIVCLRRSVDLAGIGWHPEVLLSFFTSLFKSDSWNILWYVIVFILVISWRKIVRDKALAAGWLLASLALAGIISYYLFTGQYYYAVNQMATSRALLALAPLALFLAVISMKKIPD
jgi:hypothetical protein